MPHTRSDDSPAVKPVRTVPFGTILGLVVPVVVAVVAQALVLWKGQGEQTLQIRHLSEKIAEQTAEVRAMSAQMALKSSKDAEQDARLIEVDRRLTRLELRP
jgi:hypothetical protein